MQKLAFDKPTQFAVLIQAILTADEAAVINMVI
jgi:hypothetical protein